MKYDKIIVIREGDNIEFYFDRKNGRHWFYEIHSIKNEEGIKLWDEHLMEKMWYTPDVRKKTIYLMYDLIK